MIKFEALVKAIHSSIRGASQTVEHEGMRFLTTFFDPVDSDGERVKHSRDTDYSEIYDTVAELRPKSVEMEYPALTSTGVEAVKVQVPLITLAPMNIPKITEVKFTSQLEISTDADDNLMVSFPKHGHPRGDMASDGKINSKIEITVEANETPDGLKKLIEGYERSLRCQIPG